MSQSIRTTLSHRTVNRTLLTSFVLWRSTDLAGYFKMAVWAMQTFDSIFHLSLQFHAAAIFTLTLFFCARSCKSLSQWLVLWFLLFAHLVYSHSGGKQGEQTMRAPAIPRASQILSLLKASSQCEHTSGDHTWYSASICASPPPTPQFCKAQKCPSWCIIMHFQIASTTSLRTQSQP